MAETLYPIIILPGVSKMHVRVGKFILNPLIGEHVYENRIIEVEEINTLADKIFLDHRLPRRPSIRMVARDALLAKPLEVVPEPQVADETAPAAPLESSSMFPGASVMVAPGETAPPEVPQEPADEEEAEIDITESAWQFAQDEGVDVSEIKGTGANGRILKKDIENAVASKAA